MAGSAAFEEVSPDVGELDAAALEELLDESPDEALALLADLTRATDARLRELAKAIAARLFVDLARIEPPESRGIGRLVSRPYEPDSGDIDLDRSLDPLVQARAAGRLVDSDELVVRAWGKPRVAWCLLVDRSGSMQGEPLATAALAAAAVAVRAGDQYATLSFGRDVIAAKAMWETRSTDDVIDRVLALRGHGTTDVAQALRAAGEQLRWASAERRVTILLSDCRATEPGDVVAAAGELTELVIVAPAGDSVEAEALAGAVGARVTTVEGPSTVVAALSRVLDRG
ncbi:MAG: VWA domain-containing protein [Ilumatobacter sp.]|uniref:VWA domain-containing protein n=1 Tax=Ilumatobacter sp. TaxID=1967498 RepID=UPI0026394591|nr:vWA domain-containing protein [Ilumatobacter sp.]MDJ0769754.1 VWA domain-containing protein [Ilumatobacter sp.]